MKTFAELEAHVQRTIARPLEAYPPSYRKAFEELGKFGDVQALRRSFDLSVHAMGLAGEAGEVVDLLKKILGHAKPYDRDDIGRELGDVIWYAVAIALDLGLSVEQVMGLNEAKLKARYKEGFTVAEANAPKVEESTDCSASDPAPTTCWDKSHAHWLHYGEPALDCGEAKRASAVIELCGCGYTKGHAGECSSAGEG